MGCWRDRFGQKAGAMSRAGFSAKAMRLVGLALTLVAVCASSEPAVARHHHHARKVADPKDVAFVQFVRGFRVSALASGISPAIYDEAMSGVQRNAHVEALNAEQPEFVRPVWSYLDSAASPQRVSDGQRRLAEQANALAAIESRFGVPPEILASIWGNETNYGSNSGGFNIFEALATLAYDGDRIEFARAQLLAALKIVQQENIDPRQMSSSWAGAFGQLQMVPTTFLKSAVDGDGDGRRDLWHSAPDALASAAAELAADGWERGSIWGYEVRLPAGFPYEQADGETLKPIAEWLKLGVRTADGGLLPANAEYGGIYIPAGMRGPAFMTFANFKVILKYNNAVSYALAVCVLGDLIAGRAGVQAAWPRDEQPLSRDERIAFQTALAKLGFDPGKIDGVLGRGVKAALRRYQKARGMPADGFPTLGLLAALLLDVRQRQL
jgi:peptidoglycan lytic transglycosylase B